jgi:hypothetical protein
LPNRVRFRVAACTLTKKANEAAPQTDEACATRKPASPCEHDCWGDVARCDENKN